MSHPNFNDKFTHLKYSDLNRITNDQINEIKNEYYNLYKQEFTRGEDFVIRPEDIREEVLDLIKEFDLQVKRRNDIFSDSICSDMLDELGMI